MLDYTEQAHAHLGSHVCCLAYKIMMLIYSSTHCVTNTVQRLKSQHDLKQEVGQRDGQNEGRKEEQQNGWTGG